MSRYDELRRLAAAATPGPWHAADPWRDGCVRHRGLGTEPPDFYDASADELPDTLHSPTGPILQAVWHNDSTAGLYGRPEDALYIAAASPDTITTLLDERDRLIAALTEYAIDYHAANVEHPHGHTDPFERCPHKVCTDARNLLHHPYQEEE